MLCRSSVECPENVLAIPRISLPGTSLGRQIRVSPGRRFGTSPGRQIRVSRDVKLECPRDGQIRSLGDILGTLEGDVYGTSWGPIFACVESCNALNNLFNEVCVPNKTEDYLSLSVLNMITGINESKTLTQHISCECKCKFDGRKRNSNQ